MSAEEVFKGKASLLFLFLEDCFGLLPGWLHELHNDAFAGADLAQVTHASRIASALESPCTAKKQ